MTVSVLRWHRVNVGLVDYFGELVDPRVPRNAGSWQNRWQWQQDRLLASETVADLLVKGGMLAVEVRIAEARKRVVQLIEIGKGGYWPEEVVLDVAMNALHAAFLVAFGGSGERDVKC